MHEKPILFFLEGEVRRRVNRLKKGAWIVCRSKTGLGKKEGVMFLRGRGVETPMHTMS